MPVESEASGSTYVTPQQRRKPSHGHPLGHNPYRRNRKVSAPPELQANLGVVAVPGTLGTPSTHHKGHHANPDFSDSASSTTELIINLNNPNKLALPEGFHSGSDSGVPSEYSSWAAPVNGHFDSASPIFGELQNRSVSGSLDDVHSSGNLTDSDDEAMNSPKRNHREGITNPAYVNTEQHNSSDHPHPTQNAEHPHTSHPSALVVNSPPPLVRASTDTNILSPPSTLPGQRPRTNSMVLQLNLGNALQGASNTLPNAARSVSMTSLNMVGNAPTSIPITYPNLAKFQQDTQSLYSDAGIIGNFNSGLLGAHLSPNMGSQMSLSGYGPPHPPGAPQHASPDDDHEDPQTTDPAHKKTWFVDTLCNNLSLMYAILLFMIGLVFYSADLFGEDKTAMGQSFNVYLIVMQLMWFVYIHIDVRKYINTISNALEESKEYDLKPDNEPVKVERSADGQFQLRINLREPKQFPQHYGFTSGRHGGSLYLKIGAAVFCLGYLIHSGLNLGQKVLYIMQEDPAFDSCTCTQDILVSVLQPIYAFYQLFFIFKYSNLIINRNKRLSRFALMHCISASLLFWVFTILQETLQAIRMKKAKYASEKYGVYENVTATPAYSSTAAVLGEDNESEEEMDDEDPITKYSKDYSSGCPDKKSAWLNINYGCTMDTPLTKMINDTTPYLFPFSIEYNILIVGVWILIWENIGRMDRHDHLPSIEMTYEDDNTNAINSNMIIYVDCHSSNRGMFAGLLMTVATVISIILFFIFTSDETTKPLGLMVNGYSELIVLLIMAVAAILAFLALRNLDIMKHEVSSVDDIMLYLCLPCIFLYSVFSMVPAITTGRPLFVAVSLAQVLQAIVQTALICDGLRRCSNSSALNSKKPGRELITFLVVANVALWLLETFEIKSEEGNYYKYDYYGKESWTLLSHVTLPLALFYRFHSSVCLVDIWKAGYEVEAEH